MTKQRQQLPNNSALPLDVPQLRRRPLISSMENSLKLARRPTMRELFKAAPVKAARVIDLSRSARSHNFGPASDRAIFRGELHSVENTTEVGTFKRWSANERRVQTSVRIRCVLHILIMQKTSQLMKLAA